MSGAPHGGAPAVDFTCEPDPRVLCERVIARLRVELARSGAAIRARQPPLPIALVTPTLRLRDQVQHRVTAALGATAGVEFLLHGDLATRALQAAPAPLPRVLPPAWLRALLRPRLARIGGPLAAHLAANPSALAPLLATFRDLRDAGFAAEELAEIAPRLGATARATLALYAEFAELLAALANRGLGDEASRTRAALRVAPRPLLTLLHVGAYELTGATRELVARALPATAAFFVPTTGTDAPTRALAAAFGATLPATTAAGAATAAWPAPARARRISAANPRDELRLALRQLLAWHVHDSIPLDELGLLCRAPATYAAAAIAEAELLDGAFAGPDRPWLEHAGGGPLALALRHLRHPGDRVLARAASRRWPSGWPTADELTRRLGTAATLAERIEQCAELAALPRTDADVGRASALVAEFVAAAGLARDLADADGDGLPPDAEGALDLILALLAESGAPTRAGTLELIDLHQARALPVRRAVWIGANEKLLPRTAREDFFLPDADRRLLHAASGRPLALAGDARDEERLLLDCAKAAIGEELVVSFARSDGERELLPSPWIGLLAPAATVALSRHPLHQLVELEARTGLLAPIEAELLRLPSGGARAAEAPRFAGPDAPTLARAWQRAAATERYDGATLDWDGVLGDAASTGTEQSPSRLERLGQCPLQHFFADVLGVAEPAQATTSGELDARRRGELFHAVLEELYRDRFPAPPADPQRLAALLPPPAPPTADQAGFAEHRAALEADLAARLAAQLARPEFAGALAPALAPLRIACFSRELARFVDRDWRRLAARGVVAGQFELGGTFDVLGGAAPLPLRMRFDRILVDAAGREHVGDYKSARTVAAKASLTAALRGQELQLALYGMARLAANRPLASLELLSLDARHGADEADEEGEASDDAAAAGVVALDGARLRAVRDELAATLRTLAQLRTAGVFPLAADDGDHGICGRCRFALACRHAHGATRARVAAVDAARTWRELANKKAPRAPRQEAAS